MANASPTRWIATLAARRGRWGRRSRARRGRRTVGRPRVRAAASEQARTTTGTPTASSSGARGPTTKASPCRCSWRATTYDSA